MHKSTKGMMLKAAKGGNKWISANNVLKTSGNVLQQMYKKYLKALEDSFTLALHHYY